MFVRSVAMEKTFNRSKNHSVVAENDILEVWRLIDEKEWKCLIPVHKDQDATPLMPRSGRQYLWEVDRSHDSHPKIKNIFIDQPPNF